MRQDLDRNLATESVPLSARLAAIPGSLVPRLPNAALVVVPDAEHAPWIDAPDLCVSHTQAFLSE